jgi:hypothetical protein
MTLLDQFDIGTLKGILRDPRYHSPEHSPERSEDSSSSTQLERDDLIVYDLSWRSEEVIFTKCIIMNYETNN